MMRPAAAAALPTDRASAGRSSARRPSSVRVKATSGRAIARRLTMSMVARSSERADLRNFSRAGRGIEQLAHFDARAVLAGPESPSAGPSDLAAIDLNLGMRLAVRLAMESRATAPMRGQRLAAKAHGVDMRKIVLAGSGSLEVAWRSMASARSARVMPLPSSSTRISRRRRRRWRCRCGVAPASSAFSTSSFTARGRPLHHFAGGDAVDDPFGQLADGHLIGLIRFQPTLSAQCATREAKAAATPAIPRLSCPAKAGHPVNTGGTRFPLSRGDRKINQTPACRGAGF